MFICFEGIDGCGKTTQIKLLEQYLSQLDVRYVLIREPGGTLAGEEIRSILLHKELKLSSETELMLFIAARAQMVREIIRPALDKGELVLADRFMDSSVAYQGAGRMLGMEIVERLNRFAVGETRPDITIYIDVPVLEAVSRMRKDRKNDKIEVESLEFFERVRNGYMKLIEKEKNRYSIVDGTEPVEAVQRKIRKIVAPFLPNDRLNRR